MSKQYSYILGRTLGWGIIYRNVCRFNVACIKDWRNFLQQYLHEDSNFAVLRTLKNFTLFYGGVVSNYQPNTCSDILYLHIGLVHSRLEKYIYGKKCVYPFCNENQKNLLHINNLTKNQVTLFLEYLPRLWVQKDGSDMYTIVVDVGPVLDFFENDSYTKKLQVKASKKRKERGER